jgi:undecaprenyl-diphosphatase
MNQLFIFGAKYLLLFSILIGGVWFYKLPANKKKSSAIFGALTLGMSFILGKLASLSYYDSRPFVAEGFTPLINHIADNGFPSDHMLLVSAIAAIVSAYNKKIGLSLWIIAVLVGISRINVGVHHPIDILGSALIACISSGIIYFALKKRRVV